MPRAKPYRCLVAAPASCMQKVVDVAGNAASPVAQASQAADVLDGLKSCPVAPGHTMPALRLEFSERQTSIVSTARARLASIKRFSKTASSSCL